VDRLTQDVRYAIRTLAKTPLLTALAILCLSLGIGANATMFSVVDSTLIQPLPFREPERLIDAWSVRPSGGSDRSTVSYPDFLDWRRESRSFEVLSAVQERSLTLSGGEDPERVQGAAVSAGLFTMLGIAPALGRDIAPDDDVPGAAPVIVLTDQLWRRRYKADPAIVGQAIDVNGRPHTAIGVLPAKVNFPFLQVAYVALAPLAHQAPRADRDLQLFGRLAPGVTLDQARADLVAVAARLGAAHPDDKGWSARVRPLRDYFAPDEVKLVSLAALGAVTLVLLIACANVANLLLARATARSREMSLRAALGAGRGRLVRQLLTEAVVLGLVSVPLGIALTYVGIALVTAGVPADDVPYLIQFRVDRTTLIYTVGVAALSSLVFGLAPAWQLSRVNLIAALREGGRTGSGGARTRGRSILVVVEVALALVLLVGASLFVRSFLNMQLASAGFDPSPIMTLRVYLPGHRYEEAGAKARRIEDIIGRIERVAGVRAAAASNLIPLDGGGIDSRVVVDGVASEPGREPSVFFAGVTSRFFETLDLPLVRGRGLTKAEAQHTSPVAIVNVSFARRFFDTRGTRAASPSTNRSVLRGAADLGNIDPVGRRVQLLAIENAPWLTIVGVVPDFMTDEMDSTPGVPALFAAYPYLETPNTGIIVRATGRPAALTAALRAAIRESDPGIPVFAISTLEEVRGKGLWQYKLFSWMFSIFGGLALVLGSAGVYGVLSYAVSQRTQELGVRIALGAGAADVLKLTVGQGLRLVGIGVAAGVIGAAAVTQIIGSLLYNVTPTDPISFAVVIVLLGSVGVLASYLPARRASRIDPVVALRSE
jgi:putative ABC transport system permease protein